MIFSTTSAAREAIAAGYMSPSAAAAYPSTVRCCKFGHAATMRMWSGVPAALSSVSITSSCTSAANAALLERAPQQVRDQLALERDASVEAAEDGGMPVLVDAREGTSRLCGASLAPARRRCARGWRDLETRHARDLTREQRVPPSGILIAGAFKRAVLHSSSYR
ncbi:hypothetical protein GGX14DRAFT_577444 [Mycena pura]|uniref:Uncharacterized protein n=1 Tax=Mycena pura TaxID=153505 RepID=A0AAD6URV4_9AGAR|nr:hypothetical protein GGX14DRAFT_577444 [Mycena pura]